MAVMAVLSCHSFDPLSLHRSAMPLMRPALTRCSSASSPRSTQPPPNMGFHVPVSLWGACQGQSASSTRPTSQWWAIVWPSDICVFSISVQFISAQVICCEDPGGAFGKPKRRSILGVSTPAHPMILASALEPGGSAEDYYAEGMPLAGEELSLAEVDLIAVRWMG